MHNNLSGPTREVFTIMGVYFKRIHVTCMISKYISNGRCMPFKFIIVWQIDTHTMSYMYMYYDGYIILYIAMSALAIDIRMVQQYSRIVFIIVNNNASK